MAPQQQAKINMTENDILTLKRNVYTDDVYTVEGIYDDISKYVQEPMFRLAIIYMYGVTQGKRQERAKRRKGGAAV